MPKITRNKKGEITRVNGKPILEGFDEWIRKDKEKHLT